MGGGVVENLLEPIKIGKVEIKNRVAMAPMGIGGLTNADGSPGPRAVDYYIERARGGVGLIITSNYKVENEIDLLPQNFMLVTPAALAPLAELAEVVHAFGTKIFFQLTAGFGRVASPRMLRGQPVSASATSNYWDPTLTCRELTTPEIENLIKAFGVAALILAEAGIDGIELHGHEGYLFDQFATALWNHRTDKYGGDLAARLNFPVEALLEIKRQVGQKFPVQYRFGLKHYIKAPGVGALPSEEYVEIGRDIVEGVQMAKMLEKAGFDALHVDAGCYESWYWAHPPGYHEHGCMVDLALEVKKVVKIPVIAVGRLDLPELAERVIAEGQADMVSIGRGLLADPFWVKKLAEGRKEHIRPCISCHEGCMGRLVSGKPISCAVNPSCGRERAYALEPVHNSKDLMVIGGGPAGMEAARVAALRGHKVVLYEKTDKLGGHLAEISAMAFKADELRLLNWYKTELADLQIEIRLNTKVTPEFAYEKNPDAVIVATGSKPIALAFPGADGEMLITAVELLAGEKQAGERVVVIGGGRVGCETALWLAQQDKEVTIVERLDGLMLAGSPIPRMNRTMLLDLLKLHKVNVMTNVSLFEVIDEGVVLINKSFRKTTIAADTLVAAVGLEPEQEAYKMLRGQMPDLYIIGDARETRNIMSAVWDAYEVARAI